MASFKIWNGTAWVPFAGVTQVEVIGGSEKSGLLNQPTMCSPKIPASAVPAINATKGLKVNYSYVISE